MKKALISSLFALLFTGLLSAQEIKSSEVQEFNKVSISGNINAVLVKSDVNSIEAKLNDSEVKKFNWTVKDGTLTVRLKPNMSAKSSAEVKICYKEVSAIEATQSSVRFEGEIRSGIFSARLSSGATLSAELYASDATIRSEGNSAISIKGEAPYITLTATTKGKIDARDFSAKSAAVSASFGSEVFVWGSEKLDAKAVSGAAVYYKGNPEILKVSAKTLGTVEQFSR